MNLMPKFYDIENMTQEHLNEIALERNSFAKEIERLNKKIEEIQKINLADHKYASEMEDKYITTNNIINELEKWLLEENKKKQKWYNEQLTTNDKRYYEEKYLTSLNMINVFFDKIQELKGDSSNE